MATAQKHHQTWQIMMFWQAKLQEKTQTEDTILLMIFFGVI